LKFAADAFAFVLLRRENAVRQLPQTFLQPERFLQTFVVMPPAFPEGIFHDFATGNAALQLTVGSGEFFRGAGRGNSEKWLKCLDEWSVVCDSVLAGPGKKLGVGEGFTGRKSNAVSSWGGKFSKALDRMTTAKGFDSPTVYTAGLSKLLHQAQMFDEHVKAFSNSFTPTPYSTLPPDIRHQIELRLKRSSEFFASVVLTWVVRDLGLLLDKYVKKGEKWLAE